ncbi:hypothetical protein EVJ50_04705 [Synechococcus sp. RSCCF101]|uniref:hypothetical protein n=1 Tax=Synechococcus sp. RSCCF101 TaxID=2511069 RepID=UPI00124758F8|nr:hypothetical protein [Synechococcus sp. RSCCF101]QEY31656.1 hypothetical protein EVJ50_04705 [Synechococcus sp. RSCCF101]
MVVETLDPSHLALIAAQPSPALQETAPLIPHLRRWLLGASLRPILTALLPFATHQELILTAREGNRVLALCCCSPANRRRSCWQLDDRLVLAASATLPRRQVERSLLQEAMHRVQGAGSWMARIDAADGDGLSLLRELGYQSLRHSSLWSLPAVAPRSTRPPLPPLPDGLELMPIDRSQLNLFRQLEQSACPPALRELLDRRLEDLLDQCGRGSRLLVDRRRQTALAALRRIPDRWRPAGPATLELLCHRAWDSRLDQGLAWLLQVRPRGASSAVVRVDDPCGELRSWLTRHDCEPVGDEVLMARSVWRRQQRAHAVPATRRLEVMLGKLQPGRTPLPTPATPLPPSPGTLLR